MCGRFVTGSDEHSWRRWNEILRLTTDGVPALSGEPFVPTASVPIIRQVDGSQTNELVWARWGLAPSWMKNPLQQRPQYNVRSETAPTKFKKYFTTRRCLLPATGFWVRRSAKGERAYVSVPDTPLFALAGLWTERELDGETLRSCTILTTGAAPELADFHERAPVILLADRAARWLDPDCSLAELSALCASHPTLAVA
jgi:putative SOS response-associated peptidase YedK